MIIMTTIAVYAEPISYSSSSRIEETQQIAVEVPDHEGAR
jgi:hypothetical protein